MKNIKAHLRNHFFFYILAPLVVISGAFSYYRFMVSYDYLVSYEGMCDPTTEKCFTGCEDDECTNEYYYSKVIKYAPDLEKECGVDITDCEEANVCLPEDRGCSVTYCDPEINDDVCANTQNNEQINPMEDEPLKNNDSNNNI